MRLDTPSGTTLYPYNVVKSKIVRRLNDGMIKFLQKNNAIKAHNRSATCHVATKDRLPPNVHTKRPNTLSISAYDKKDTKKNVEN